MNSSFLRTASTLLLAAMIPASASSQNATAPDPFRLDLHANFITQNGDWTSSGAFSDSGIIADVAEHAPKGNPLHAANLSVVETLSGNAGSFTWRFTRHFAPVAGPLAGQNATFRTGGAWQIIDGTGAYAGMSGQGTFEGTINVATGDIYDTYEGYVQLAP